MKKSRVLKSILFISGLIGVGVGGAILTMPEAFYAGSGIDLGGNISLLNEVRASGGAILVIGILIILGAFVAKITFTSAIISILLYLSYGLSRILSMIIDGMPVDELVLVAVLEIIIGLICFFSFLKYRE